jgi:hypothetical protein
MLAAGLATCAIAAGVPAQPATGVADAVYRNALVVTMDQHQPRAQALAVRSGRLVYVGTNAGARAYIGSLTEVHDVGGRLLMPGLIDGHMHPLAGGRMLTRCNLGYARMDAAELQARIRSCLDERPSRGPSDWLQVANWFQEGMTGTVVPDRRLLDALGTDRPIMVFSSFGHTALLNSRALALAAIDATTPDPLGGVIERDAQGLPTGILQDAAFEGVLALIPPPTADEESAAAEAALLALRTQGVTTVLDAAADEHTMAAFAARRDAGRLTARLHFAVHVKPPEGGDPAAVVARLRSLAGRYDSGPLQATPGLSVHNVKLFLDGVISGPAFSGAMLEPYFENRGTPAQPRWEPGSNRGPDVYFPPATLAALLEAAAIAGFEPHLHADGDRAVRAALDAAAVLRVHHPAEALRVAVAHDEVVDPSDFPRYRSLGVAPVLSFQWEKPAPDTVGGLRDPLGPARYRLIEPAGLLARAGAPIAFGSDWPVDSFAEWLALEVAVTRSGTPASGPEFQWHLGDDPGLGREQALRAATLGSAWELHREHELGSLERGKWADFIILDRNVLEIPVTDISATRVLQTVVGGKTVYAESP